MAGGEKEVNFTLSFYSHADHRMPGRPGSVLTIFNTITPMCGKG